MGRQWRHKERLRIERQRATCSPLKGESGSAKDLERVRTPCGMRFRRDEKRWLIPSYDGSSSDAIEDAQASGVSELVDRLFHRARAEAQSDTRRHAASSS